MHGKTAGALRARGRVSDQLALIDGVYVPAMYEVSYDGPRIVAVEPLLRRRARAGPQADNRRPRRLAVPETPLVPLTEVVHDRLSVEVFRGCTRGCRFCQAGMITRPVRERPADQVRTMVRDGLRRTGQDEVSLTSLSTADFSGIERVVHDAVNDPTDMRRRRRVAARRFAFDAFTVNVAASLSKGRRTGSTFAPEAGLVATAGP